MIKDLIILVLIINHYPRFTIQVQTTTIVALHQLHLQVSSEFPMHEMMSVHLKKHRQKNVELLLLHYLLQQLNHFLENGLIHFFKIQQQL